MKLTGAIGHWKTWLYLCVQIVGIDKGNGYFVLKSILILTRKRLEGGGGVGYITQIQSKHTDGVSK